MSSEHIDEKKDGPHRGFGYSSLFSYPTDLAKMEPKRKTVILQLSTE